MAMRRIGTGFELINCPTIEIDSGDPDIGIYSEIEPTTLEKAKEIMETVKTKRGEIISICTDIDYLLTEGISNFFLEKDSEKRQILQSLILNTTFLTFGQRKNIFKLITERYPQNFGRFSIKEERNKFFSTLEEIIKYRNALAHGHIIIDYNDNIITLEYYNSNNNKLETTELNPAFFQSLQNKLSQTILDFYSGIYDKPKFVVSNIEITKIKD